MKRIIVFICLLFLALGLLAQTAVQPAGEGTEANPYQIATWQNLYWLSHNSSAWDKHFIQTEDIDFADATPAINTWANGQGWTPIGIDLSNSFTGKYNGNSKAISGLFICPYYNLYRGLFGYLNNGAEIINLGLININVTGSGIDEPCAGGLVGYNSGNITNCYSSGSVNVYGYSGGLVGRNSGTITNCYNAGNVSGDLFAGGLVGSNSGTITNCYSTGNVTGEEITGGLVGYIDSGTITNCYNTGNVSGIDFTGGLVGYIINGTITTCYSTGNVSGGLFAGGLVGHINSGTITNSYYNYEYVLINNNHSLTTGALTNELYTVWFPNKSLNIDNYLTSDGTNYLINSVNDFKILLAFGQFCYSFKLNSNLDFSTESNIYIPYFVGIFNGNGNIISNLIIDLPNLRYTGLFGFLNNGAEIINLGLININVTGSGIDDRFVGGLVGYLNRSNISNCYITGSGIDELCTGGLVGRNFFGTVTNCYNTGNVTGDESSGGLVRENHGTISNSYNSGNITGEEITGGLVGENYGTITNSYNIGNVTGGESSGGLVGRNSGNITNCYSSENVTGEFQTGGLVGRNSGNITNCYSIANVAGDDYTGGLVGRNDFGSIINCYSAGNVSGDNYTGGLVGNYSGYVILNSFWDVETSGQTSSSYGTGLTTIEMKTQSTYTNAGWTFPIPWLINPEINQGYPYLNYEAMVSTDDMTIETPLQTKAVLYSAYPNPFNPSTTISFDLVKPETVKIEIYNVKGQIVKQLVNKAYDKGNHSLVWDGKDTQNKNCGTGVYFYRMTAGKTTQTKKMIMMK